MPRTPDSSPQTLKVFSALLHTPADWHYGYGLSKQTGLAPGTLYPILARLVERGLLDTRWEPSDQPGRPPRHLYRLSGDGQELALARTTAAAAKAGAQADAATDRGGRAAKRPITGSANTSLVPMLRVAR